MTVEQRLANGEILYRTKDYARAGVVFSEILEQYPDTASPSYPDALFLRGETYFESHEYLSARRDFRQLVQRGTEARYQPYFAKALERLVDVSIRVERSLAGGLDEVFRRKLSQVPPVAGRRGAMARVREEGQGLLREEGLRRRDAGVRLDPHQHARHAPGALLPGAHRDEAGAGLAAPLLGPSGTEP